MDISSSIGKVPPAFFSPFFTDKSLETAEQASLKPKPTTDGRMSPLTSGIAGRTVPSCNKRCFGKSTRAASASGGSLSTSLRSTTGGCASVLTTASRTRWTFLSALTAFVRYEIPPSLFYEQDALTL